MAGLCPPLAGLAAGKGWRGSRLGMGLSWGPWFWPVAEVGARAACPGWIRNQLHGIPTTPWHLGVLPCMGQAAAPQVPAARAELSPRQAQRAPLKAPCPVTCGQPGAWGCPGVSQSWQEVTLPPKAWWWPGSPAAGRGTEQAGASPLGHRKPCPKGLWGERDGPGSVHNWGYPSTAWGQRPPLGCLSLQKCAHTHAPCLLSYPAPAPSQPLPISPRVPFPDASRAASCRGVVPSCPGPLLPIACKPLCAPAHPPCIPQAGLGVGGALGDTKGRAA